VFFFWEIACYRQADDPDDCQLDVDKLEALAGSREKVPTLKKENKFSWGGFVLWETACNCQADNYQLDVDELEALAGSREKVPTLKKENN